MHSHSLSHRLLAALLGTALAASAPFSAMAQNGDGVRPEVDETCYVLLDSYGNPRETSVVKSWRLNGATEITDYGRYDSVKNLTDSTEAERSENAVRFRFGKDAPDTFYFEGKDDTLFRELPFRISLSYSLNGVPARAEELAEEKGVVEIRIKAVPREESSEWMRNNWFLTAAAVFNQNDILSLSAPDAQMQTLGNIKTALFFWLPGEEREYTLRVGTEKFSFGGVSFMMGPLNASGRLGDIKDLREAKEDAEDSWNALSDASDEILDSMDRMQDNLQSAAAGLDELNRARRNIAGERGAFYGELDRFLENLGGMSEGMKPMSGHLSAENHLIGDMKQHLGELNTVLQTLKTHLAESQGTLGALKKDMRKMQDNSYDLDHDAHRLKTDIARLRELGSDGKKTVDSGVRGTLSQMTQLYKAYASYRKSLGLPPFDAIGDGRVIYDLTPAGESGATPGNASGAGSLALGGLSYPEGSFQEFAIEQLEELNLSEEEIVFALSVWERRDEVSKLAKSAEKLYGGADRLADDLGAFGVEPLTDLMADLSIDGESAVKDLSAITEDLSAALSGLDSLHGDADSILSELMPALEDSARLCDEIQKSSDSLAAFLGTARNIMRQNSSALHSGTDKALSNASGLLRKSSEALDSTDALRNAKQELRDLVDSKWDEHTGEKSNIFKLDAEAGPLSLTSPQNDCVKSVSVLIRSEEIKAPEDEVHLSSGDDGDHRGFLRRVGQMFADLWRFLTGWIRK